jgi:hypothetical protein
MRYWFSVFELPRFESGWAFGDSPDEAAERVLAGLVRDKARGVGTLYLRPEQGPDSIFTVDVSAKSITPKKCICALCAM